MKSLEKLLEQKFVWYKLWAQNQYSSLVHLIVLTIIASTAFSFLMSDITNLALEQQDANLAILIKSNHLPRSAAPARTIVDNETVNEVIVGFIPSVSMTKRNEIAQTMRLTKKRDISSLNASIYTVSDEDTASEVADRVRHVQKTEVAFVEPNTVIAPEFVPNDPLYTTQWHIPKVGIDIAWDTTHGEGITVAIIDTGVDCIHPELVQNCLLGFNISSNNTDATDIFGHGTEVAGVVAAAGDNMLGVAGVAYGAKILPIRITNDLQGYANYADIASGIVYAADHGAKIANVSYAAYDSQTVTAAASYLASKGGMLTIAAGNAGTISTTKNDPNSIVVSATDMGDIRTSWSSYGTPVDVSAPGLAISTTAKGGGFISMSGTSFSAPLTAGVAALVWSRVPTLTNVQVVNAILGTSVDLGQSGYDQEYGFGRIDASLAAAVAASGTIPTITYQGGGQSQQFVLTSYAVLSKTKNEGVVAWETNLPATGRVRYGTSVTTLGQSVEVMTANVSQQTNISGLEARKKYYYQIEATDAAGNVIKSPVTEFRTRR